MKQCPACQSQYTDDTLQFCLQDGSPLRFVSSSEGKTIAFGEQETVVSNRQSNQINTPPATNPTDWNPHQFSSNPSVPPPVKKSGAPVAVFLTAFVMLLLFSFVGFGAWLYFRGATPDKNTNLLLAKKKPDSEPSATRTMPVTTRPTTSSDTTSSNSTPVDPEQIKKDVADKVYSWKSAAESLNLDSYMNNYADTISYYNKGNASRATVRADKQRAFTTYSSIKINLSNMTVTPDSTGANATAVFDKEWIFSGAKYSAGKVQTQLKLKKSGGQWLITDERDLKVYYTQK